MTGCCSTILAEGHCPPAEEARAAAPAGGGSFDFLTSFSVVFWFESLIVAARRHRDCDQHAMIDAVSYGNAR